MLLERESADESSRIVRWRASMVAVMASKMFFVGLDIGTSAVKAVLVGEDQQVVATANAPVATHRPRSGWSEQDPEDWWRATLAVFNELRAGAPGAWGNVKAIGLSGQMHAAVLLDRDDQVVRPAILWNDSRAVRESDEACPAGARQL